MEKEIVAVERLVIKAPDMRTVVFEIRGTAPYVQLRFSEKAKAAMRAKMELGSQATKSRAKSPRDFDEDYRNAMYESADGHRGIQATAFRKAMISACRLVGYKMTIAKMSVFVLSDCFDAKEGWALVKIKGTPEKSELTVRNATGVADIRVRAMWREWSASVAVKYDADQFSQQDVANLMMRAGIQVGVGEGRPDSTASAGLDWGTFELV